MKKFILTNLLAVCAALCVVLASCTPAAVATERGNAPAAAPPSAAASGNPFYTGDGGKGKSIAILAPQSVGLAAEQGYIPAVVQGEFVSNFSGYSAISVLDRERLDAQYAELLSGYYDDNAQAGRDLGHLTPTEYIMGGNITKTATGYALQIQITKSADKMTAASYSGTCTFAELDNLSGIRRASADLLAKMGVTLTAQAKTELSGAAAENHVNAQTTLAQGIAAQKSGTVVEALSYYIASSSFDPALAEAGSRVNVLSADISSGNIGDNVRNEIQWRNDWIARLTEAEQFYATYVSNPQAPYTLAYTTDLKQGEINWSRETVTISGPTVSLFLDSRRWLDTIARTVQTVKDGLEATGRTSAWNLNWPSYSVSGNSISGRNGSFNVVIELRNSNGEAIGRQTVRMPYGFYTNVRDGKFTIATEQDTLQKAITFENVNANKITNNLSIAVASIDGMDTRAAAQSKHITVATEAELWRTGYFHRVGGTGPAGGVIVSVTKDNRHGVEVSPASAEFQATWNDANAKCKTLVINGYTGWRLPTRDDLSAMYEYSWKKLGMKESWFFLIPFWTSDTGYYESNSNGSQSEGAYIGYDQGRSVNFLMYYGGYDSGHKVYARAVRDF